jgi:hypothetical protein
MDDDELRVEHMFGCRMNVPRYSAELRGIMASHYVAVYNETAGVMAELGIGVNLPDTYQLEILSRGGTQAGLIDLTGAAKARALEIIRQGRENGQNAEEIAADLEKAVPAGRFLESRTRAELIARTETRVAQTESALKIYSERTASTR